MNRSFMQRAVTGNWDLHSLCCLQSLWHRSLPSCFTFGCGTGFNGSPERERGVVMRLVGLLLTMTLVWIFATLMQFGGDGLGP